MDVDETLRERFKVPSHFAKLDIRVKGPGVTENLVVKLRQRSINGGYPYQCCNPLRDPQLCNNSFYCNIVPNFTCEDVDKPNCILRKFSFDGRYLLAFSAGLSEVVIFEYQGCNAAASLLRPVNYKLEKISEYNDETDVIKSNLFGTILRLKHRVQVTTNSHYLHRDFVLFLDDNRHVILFASKPVSEESVSYYDLNRNNESLNLTQRPKGAIEDFTMLLFDFVDGRIADQYCFKCDRINTIFQHGVFLYHRTLSVFSLQHQTIHIFHISPSYKFVKIHEIGRFANEDDARIVAQVIPPREAVAPFREIAYTALKQRLLAHIVKHIINTKQQPNCLNLTLNEFYKHFDFFLSMKMWRLQLLDENHVFIKFEIDDMARLREYPEGVNLYVVYNFKTAEILNLYPQNSEELLYAFENFANWFRYPLTSYPSASNNCFAKQSHERFKQVWLESRNGDWPEAVKYILQSLPIHCQIYSFSPFLDVSLFSYEDRIINSADKPRPNPEFAIRFHNRRTGRFAFRWHTQQDQIEESLQHNRANRPRRPLLSFIHHPNDAFVISVCRNQYRYYCNIHLRHFNP